MNPSPQQAGSALCAICQSALSQQEPRTQCPHCHSSFHQDCWEENGGCAVYGCAGVPPTEGRASLEIPPAYWGQENKPCPRCGKEILAAAVRCRHCGAMFSSSRPEDSSEYRKRQQTTERLPSLKRTAVLIFVFCALPCTAVVASGVGVIWYRANRAALASVPPLYAGLLKVGLGLGFGQTLLAVVALLLYSAFHQP